MPQADKYNHKAFNKYINAEVVIPKHDHVGTGQVIGQKKDQDGNLIGRSNPDPVLDTCILEVQFPDGNVQEYGANVIAEHIYSQVDDKGCRYLLMDEIVDHGKDGLVVAANDLYYTDMV
jgi:hypothetical protein